MSRQNQVDIGILQRYVDRSERLACWNYLDAINLRQAGCQIAYAVLTAQIVWSSASARRYAAVISGFERHESHDITGGLGSEYSDRSDGAMVGAKPLLNGSSMNSTRRGAAHPLYLTMAFGGLHGACGP
jgi:hypothetical protein